MGFDLNCLERHDPVLYRCYQQLGNNMFIEELRSWPNQLHFREVLKGFGYFIKKREIISSGQHYEKLLKNEGECRGTSFYELNKNKDINYVCPYLSYYDLEKIIEDKDS